MTSPDVGVPVPVLLETLRLRVESTSLRKTAAEAGLSPNAVRNLNQGAKPHPATVQKLRDWFKRLNETRDAGLSEEVAEAALTLLIQALPDDSQRRATEAVLSVLEAHYLREGMVLPSGLLKLREKLDAG
jgi:hypothetical protein